MEGVDDDQPSSSKRLKLSSGESGSLSEGKYVGEAGSSSMSGSMARVLASQEDDEVVGSKGLVKKVELVRVMTEALYSLGYSNTGARLEEESGIPLHSNPVDLFRKQIIDGKWDESIITLQKMDLTDETIVKSASFMILEQKFFELLDGQKVNDASKTLRTEMAPLQVNDDRVRELADFILRPYKISLDKTRGQESRKNLLKELQQLLPPMVIIPENRLTHLVEQAIYLQRDRCRFHNSSIGNISLLRDHQCGIDQIPWKTLEIISGHEDEVWFVQFSHNGEYLASGSRDHLVLIYKVGVDGKMSLLRQLNGHMKAVSYISWSHDDRQLLTCGEQEVVNRWDIISGVCLCVYTKFGVGFVSCGWAADGMNIFTAGNDDSISMWGPEATELDRWAGQKTIRNGDLGITTDGKELITLCTKETILFFEWETKAERFIKEDQAIYTFSLSDDTKLLLLCLWNGDLHLWNIDGCLKLIKKYVGHRRLIDCSCFGGVENTFIAGGSEDSEIYIWHRLSGELLLKLSGHTLSVNGVSWNPVNPRMLASASDDHTVRIWGSPQTTP